VSRGTRIAVAAGALVALQVALVVIYREVQRRRQVPASAVIAHVRAEGAAPPLAVRRPDGTTVALADLRGRPVLVHFWATWCPPCRDELPALLATGDALGGEVALLAVATDEDWATVRHFLGGEIAPSIVLGPGSHRAFAVDQLPATFVVTADGALTARIDGARAWTVDGVRRLLASP
jgi:thiol-disulfide isomerase/thioredoxin